MKKDMYINILMDLGDYDLFHAAEIYRLYLKKCRSERERSEKCYEIIEKRRNEIGINKY